MTGEGFCSRYNFRAITRLETFAMQATYDIKHATFSVILHEWFHIYMFERSLSINNMASFAVIPIS